MVTPGPSCRVQRRRLRGPPADVREGVENAYIAITEVKKTFLFLHTIKSF